MVKNKMKKKKTKYIIFPHITVSILIHWFLFILCVLVWTVLGQNNPQNGETANAVIKFLAVFLPIILLISVVVFNVFYWNAWVTVDERGMRQRRGLRILEWNWDEIAEVKCRVHRSWPLRRTAGMYSPKFVFLSSAHQKKLSVVMEKYTRKVFFDQCRNEEIKQKCRELLDSCNFKYV